MVKEGDLVGLDENKLRISEILDEIHESASSVFEFSLQWEEIEEKLKERAIEVDLKERSLMEQIVEFEKKEERLKEVEEERERKIGLLEKSITLRLVEKEKENDVKQFMESSLMRLVCEKKEEELEEREKKVELLSKLIDEKSCELDWRVKEFDLKEKVSIERRNKEAETVAISLKELEAKEKELSLLDEAVKEKLAELEKKKENFEGELKEKAEQIEEKSKFLELKKKKLEEMVNEVEMKQREFQEPLKQAETCKRPRVKMLAEKCSEADSPLPPTKKHKSDYHDDEDEGEDPACVVSASASSSEHLNEAQEGEIDEVVSIADSDDTDEEDPEPLSCLDSECHDFEKTLSSFVVGKVWALYDPIDEMPRLYGRIKRINKSQLSVQVTWLVPKDEESVPVACGRFEHGFTETMQSYLTLSHEVHPIIHGKKFIAVKPREGETWALFRDWSKSWNKNPEQQKPPYRYDLVEVISFDDHLGFGVAYLGKVEGFVSVFKHDVQDGVISFLISPEEIHRFSHRVPSFRLNGEEKEGVPAGSFELDPAAVPSSILKLDQSVREEAEEAERQGEECGKACEVEDQDGSRKDIPIIILD